MGRILVLLAGNPTHQEIEAWGARVVGRKTGVYTGNPTHRFEGRWLCHHRGMSSAESKNLEAISKAIDHHNATCPFPAAEVRMNPFEVERLGWEEIRGLPIVPDANIGTGRFHIVCSRDMEGDELEEVEAIAEELVTVTPGTGEPEAPSAPEMPDQPGTWN